MGPACACPWAGGTPAWPTHFSQLSRLHVGTLKPQSSTSQPPAARGPGATQPFVLPLSLLPTGGGPGPRHAQESPPHQPGPLGDKQRCVFRPTGVHCPLLAAKCIPDANGQSMAQIPPWAAERVKSGLLLHKGQ